MEAAATMTAQEIFFMSMVGKNKLTDRPALNLVMKNLLVFLFFLAGEKENGDVRGF